MLLWLSLVAAHGETFGGHTSAPVNGNITVYNDVLGKTTVYIGATEAGIFYIDDLLDLGINTYRMWTKMNELEWWDDDDARGDTPYDCSAIGTPTIQQIKDDQVNDFANTIPWDWWDEQFTGTYYTWSGNSRQQVIESCVQNDILPILILRTIDDQGQPNFCSGNWAPDTPISAADLNEWWEHCFAIAYWLNVLHNYGVTHFEVLNEPDLSSQGWHGSQAEYVQLVQTAYDAVKFANDIAGTETVLMAPVVSNYGSPYIAYALDQADAQIAAVDYHNYGADPTTSIAAVNASIAAHNPDSIIEPIWLSEWGTYTSSYDDINRAILTAQQLLTLSELGIEGATIFGMYDWGSFSGLLDASRDKSETYYAYRLAARGLIGAKDRLHYQVDSLNGQVMATTNGSSIYLLLINAGATLSVNVSALDVWAGQAKVYEYSAAYKDEVVDTPTIWAGAFSFTAPAEGVSLVEVPLPPDSARPFFLPLIHK